MNYLHIDKASLVGGHMIPDVFISEVSLKIAKSTTPYNISGEVHQGSARGQKKYNTGEKLLQVDIKMSFKEVVETDFASFWTVNSGMRQYVSINAILTTDKNIFNRLHALSKNPRQKFNFENTNITSFLGPSTQLKKVDVEAAVSLFKKQNDTNFINCRLDANNSSFLSEIPIHLSFDPISDINPEDLMLIVYPYIELENVLTDSTKTSTSSRSMSVGRIVDKVVVKDGKVVKNGFVLKRLDNNRIYAGSYHTMGDGRIMAGAMHNSRQRQPELYKEAVRDVSVKDYRQFKKYFDAVITKGNTKKSIFPQEIVNSLANTSLLEKKLSGFSEAWMSYDHSGRCKFAFAVNLREIILNNSRFSDFVVKNPRLASSHFDLVSMNVVRRRVYLDHDDTPGMNITPTKKTSNLTINKKSSKFFNKLIGAGSSKKSEEIK